MAQQPPLEPPAAPGGSITGSRLRDALQRGAAAITRAQKVQQTPPPAPNDERPAAAR